MAVLNFYADGSGHAHYRPPIEQGDSDYYVVAGVLVDSVQRQLLENGCDDIVHQFFPDREPRTVELKATHIKARQNRKAPWDQLPGPQHVQVFDEIRDLLHRVRPRLFGQVLHKENYRVGIHSSRPERPATNALRFMMTRLDYELNGSGDTSTVTLDSDSKEMQEAQLALETSVRRQGDKLTGITYQPTRVSQFKSLLPFKHLSSEQSRCLQMADYVAHFLWQAIEEGKEKRIRELDSLWRTFRTRREPWTGYVPPDRVRLLNG